MTQGNNGLQFAGMGVFQTSDPLALQLSKTAAGREVIKQMQAQGVLMGKFLPGLMKVVKNVGKITSPFTTALAKTFLPSGVVNALAKADPSAHAALLDKMSNINLKTITAQALPSVQNALQSMTVKPAAYAPNKSSMKKYLIIGGATAATAGVLFLLLKRKGKK
ncbi:MAG: hypothetical protein WBM07_17055 [Chitinivibrionales bacterium]